MCSSSFRPSESQVAQTSSRLRGARRRARAGSGAQGGPTCGTASDAGGNDAGRDGGSFVPPSDAGAASCFAVDPAHDGLGLDAAIASPLTQAWAVTLGGPISFPVVAGNLAIVSVTYTQPSVQAFDLATGQLVWGPIAVGNYTTLAVEGDGVFALGANGRLSAFDAATGTKRWEIPLEGQTLFESPPVAKGGLVYANGEQWGGTTYAIDERTGATVWTANFGEASSGTVAVKDGVVYVGGGCDFVYAFDAFTGASRWTHYGGCQGGTGSTPAVYGGLVWDRDEPALVLDLQGNAKGTFQALPVPSFAASTVFYGGFVDGGHGATALTAVDIPSGATKWSFTEDVCTPAVVAGASGQVFVGSASGKVYELDEETGAQRSVATTVDGGSVNCGVENASMAISGNRLLVPAGSTLVAY